MSPLTEAILGKASALQEGQVLVAKHLLHLGSRAAIDQVLSRLVRRGQIIRVGRGIYARAIETRFGARPPAVPKVVEGVASLKGETIVPHGALAANALGLTTQVPMRAIYLTSGRSRRLRLGAQEVELRHAPHWQLALPNSPVGQAIRALAWLGPKHVHEGIVPLRRRLSPSQLQELAASSGRLPSWMAKEVSGFANG